jgi:parallel beta-helix repeat protein
MVRSSGNTIEENVIHNNLDGITVYGRSNNNIISNNVVSRNDYQGILVCNSDGIRLTGNRVFGNYYGIYLSPSNGSLLRNNDISNNGYGGLEILDGCMNNVISGNTINVNLESGVNIYGSSGNRIEYNAIRFNKYGVSRNKAGNNFLYGNSITDNWSANLHDWT